MNILIAGIGKVGSTLIRQLSAEGHDLTVIDSNQDVLSNIVEQFDVMSCHGNCASAATLKEAGIKSAELLIALTGADELNLLTCMTAHCLNPRLHTIARIRNPEYREQAYDMRQSFALSLIVNPEKQAADEIERVLRYPGFLRRDTFANGHVEIVELRIGADSKLKNVALTELNRVIHCRVLICAVLRDGKAITPAGSFVLEEGDRVFVTAPTANLSLLLSSLGLITRKLKRLLIAGGDKVCYYLAEALRHSGASATLIEQDAKRCLLLAAQLPSVNVVHGDAGDRNLLQREGLNSCDAFVTLTGLDELNILLSLYARKSGVPQVVTKLGHMENPLLIDSLPLGSVVCPRDLCANTIVRYVRAMQNQKGAAVTLHKIADNQAEAVEFIVDEDTLHCDEPLKDIKLRPNILLVSITRGARTEIPNGLSRFHKGDNIVVVSNGDTVLHNLNDVFE